MKLLATFCAVGFLSFGAVGCQNNDKHSGTKYDASSVKDACSKCPGKQVADSDGTCPACNAKHKGM